tara:strand:- start:3877 stop:4083 length:207 start_codon:yes stop_codon:yes gene_type:complete
MISVWNITFDIDGELFVLDEGKIGGTTESLIRMILTNLNEEDLRPIDKFDIKAILEHEGFNLVKEDEK